jgi:hypothetical protein
MNWRNYNESLVKRGDVLLDFDVIDNWHIELDEMNTKIRKVENLYIQIHLFTELLGYIRVYFHLPYRQTEGVVRREHASSTLPSIPFLIIIVTLAEEE